MHAPVKGQDPMWAKEPCYVVLLMLMRRRFRINGFQSLLKKIYARGNAEITKTGGRFSGAMGVLVGRTATKAWARAEVTGANDY